MTGECPVCRSTHDAIPQHELESYTVVRCPCCEVEYLRPQPAPEVLDAIYSNRYFDLKAEGVSQEEIASQKRETAESYIKKLIEIRGGERGSLLEIGCGRGDFLLAAKTAGFQVHGIEISQDAVAQANRLLGVSVVERGTIESVDLRENSFDGAVLSDVIEHVRDPRAFLDRVRYCLRPGGIVLIATPSTDTWSRRLMGTRWMEYKLEHLFYFNRQSLTVLLSSRGFENLCFSPNYKKLSFNYIRAHFRRYPVPVWTTAVELVGKVLPARVRSKTINIVASGVLATATRQIA